MTPMDERFDALPESAPGGLDAPLLRGIELMSNAEDGGSLSLPVGTVTFLLTDIAGSTRLWENAPQAMASATARHYELIDEVVRLCDGVRPVEQGEGDSTVSAFARASDAVRAALEIQRAVAAEPWPDGARISVRVGLHTGEAQLRDEGNYFGAAISRTARLRSTGHGGQILLSQATAELLADRLPDGATLRNLGTHRLRDLARPEHIFQLDHGDITSDFEPLVSLDALPNNLPVQLTSFIGREREMAKVRSILETSRLLTLTGAGGCGKTRLALQIAAEVLDAFPDGVWLIDLAPVADPDLVPKTVAEELSIREAPNQPMTERLRSLLRDRKLLLVLDNCEHLIDSSAALVEALLTGCPSVSILATSRESLGLQGENSWRVPSLSLPAEGEDPTIEALTQCEAVRLFVDRALRARPNFAVTNENAPAVAAVCQQLDGIPLAIELAAARTRLLTPQQIADALGDRFHLLTGGSRTAMPRQRTLEASVRWSHDLLEEDEKILLRRLSVFAGGFTLDGAEHVCSGDGVQQFRVLDLLSGLVDKSLVQVEEEGATARYRLLETIRVYARENLLTAGEIAEVRNRHLDFYVALTERAEPQLEGAGMVVWVRALEAEHDNIRAALEWSIRDNHVDQALRLVGALLNFWAVAGLLNEALQRVGEALALEGGEPAARMKALLSAALMSSAGFSTRVQPIAEEALALARQVGDQRGIGRALSALTFAALREGVETMRPRFEEAKAAVDAAGDAWMAARLRGSVANTYFLFGLAAEAKPLAEEALAIARRNHDFTHIMMALYALGIVATLTGDFDRAQALADEAIGLVPDFEEKNLRLVLVNLEGHVALHRGEYDRAHELMNGALKRSREIGNYTTESVALYTLGWLGFAEGRPDDTEPFLKEAESKSRESGLTASIARAKMLLAGAALDRGDPQTANELIEEAHVLASENGQRWIEGKALLLEAEIGRAAVDRDRAETALHDALAMMVESQDRPGIADGIEALGGLASTHESWSESARLFGAGQALRDAMGYVRFPRYAKRYEADVASARAGLGDEAFDSAFAEGAALSMEDAVAYARRARGERKRPSAGWASLTPTELEVVRLASEGLTNPQIGEKMFISRGTVKVHLSHIFAKLGFATRAELAAEATKRGI